MILVAILAPLAGMEMMLRLRSFPSRVLFGAVALLTFWWVSAPYI